MVSNLLFIIPDFFLHFPNALCYMAILGELFWKMHRKTLYSILGLDAMPLSLKNLLLIQVYVVAM